jgi:hypothetical protein
MSSIPPTASSYFAANALAARFPSLPADRSWTALLAATEWGVNSVGRRRVRIQQRVSSSEHGDLRLLVQCYRQSDTAGGRPRPYARPLGSAQRSVAAAQLASGMDVDMLHFESELEEDVVVVAWVEPGEADLEYDGLEARPANDTLFARVESFAS